MAMRLSAIYFVGFHSRAIRGDISDLAVTIFPVQAIPPSSRTYFGQVALSNQIRRSPFAGTIVLARIRRHVAAPHIHGRYRERYFQAC